MKKPYCIIAYALYLFGLTLLLSLQKNRYGWVKDFDPSVSVPQDPSGSSAVLAILLLVVMIATQGIMVIKGKKTWIKVLSGTLILLSVMVWIVKFVL